jgi:hypothetical protein
MWHCDSAWLYASTKLPFIICYVDSSCHLYCRLVNYMRESRNLLRVQDSARRRRFLYRGPVSIVACLSRLPKTQHDLPSFAVDLTLFTVSLGYSLLVQQALLSNVHVYTCSLHSLLLYILVVSFFVAHRLTVPQYIFCSSSYSLTTLVASILQLCS